MQYSLNYSGTRFCPLEIKITQFPDGFRLKVLNGFCPKDHDYIPKNVTPPRFRPMESHSAKLILFCFHGNLHKRP